MLTIIRFTLIKLTVSKSSIAEYYNISHSFDERTKLMCIHILSISYLIIDFDEVEYLFDKIYVSKHTTIVMQVDK